MKRMYFFIIIALCAYNSHLTYTISSFFLEQRYNANSFIFNSASYYTHYTPKIPALGNEALLTKKNMKKCKKNSLKSPRISNAQ